MEILEVNNIQVIYEQSILVLKGISFKIQEGSITALLGSNGAGKTTTLRAISGLLKEENGEVTKGEIVFKGKRINDVTPDERVRLGVAQVLEGRRVFETLTVEENLRASEYLRKDHGIKKHYEMIYNYFPVLKPKMKKIAGYLSGGEQQMLAIARALLTNPQLLLLDEPSLGLAPLLVKEVFKIIARINNEQKTTAFLVEQNAAAALKTSNYAYVMENGTLVLDGPSPIIAEHRNVKEFYLGTGGLGAKSFREIKHYKRKKRWFSS